MLSIRLVLAAGAIATSLGVAAAPAALAAPVSSGYPSATMDELKKQGYTCEIMSLGAWSCSKTGSPTYTCDSYGNCEVLSYRPPRTPLPRTAIPAPGTVVARL
jgi:hypothetical protein